MSPTQLTLRKLRADGCMAAVVEKWNPHAKIRQDLFGFLDIVAIVPGGSGVLGIQACTTGNMMKRIAKCDAQPLADNAIDMRGTWEVVSAEAGGTLTDKMVGSRQRIEQCGNRVVITGGGVVHDMRCDGTYENGVNDIAEPRRGPIPISVAASFEDGVHVLRPKGMNIQVTRRLEGGELVWTYPPNLELRLRRIETE